MTSVNFKMTIKDKLENMAINEIFDTPYKLKENPKDTLGFKSLGMPSTTRVHDIEGSHHKIISFIHKGAMEGHILNKDESDTKHIYNTTEASHLYGAVAEHLKDHLQKGGKIRVFGSNDRQNKLYHHALKYINRKHFNNKLDIKEIQNHKGLDGEYYPKAYEAKLHHESTFKLKESYKEEIQ